MQALSGQPLYICTPVVKSILLGIGVIFRFLRIAPLEELSSTLLPFPDIFCLFLPRLPDAVVRLINAAAAAEFGVERPVEEAEARRG